MSAIACTRTVIVSMLLAIPASRLSAQNAGEALADRLRSFNQSLDFAGGVAAARANPQALRSSRARAWYTLLLARDGDGRAALAVADSLQAADRRSPWSAFARSAALGYGFSDSSAAALAASEELLRRAPHHPDAVQLRGATLVNSGRPLEALAVVDSFLVRNPDAVPHLVLRGNTTWAAGAARPPNPARKDSAIALWARARALDSTYVFAWSAAGSRLQNDGRLAEALPLLRRASELAPLSLRVNRDYWRALRSQHAQNPEQAKAEALPGIERILAARGYDPAILLDVTYEYEAFRMPEARRALEDRILRDHPATVSADWVLVNRYRVAETAMRDTTRRDSTLKGTYRRLLQEFVARPTHAEERLLGDAYLSLFAIADSTTPPDTLLAIVLGMERFEKMNPHLTFARGALALADRRVHLDQAERLARAGQQAGRRRVEAGRQVYEGLGEYARALDRMNATMVEALGWVHFQAGRAEVAESELRQALDLDPQNMSALHHLGRLFEAAGRLDSAESYYIRGAMVATPFANPNRAALQALYVARRGSAEGYDQYYAGIRDLDRARRRATIATEIKATRDRDTLPSFQLNALSGDTVRSSTLAGRVTVINFWGMWCGPCVVEMPEVQRFWQSVARDTTVHFQTISNDQNLRDLREWLGQRRYDIPVLVDAGYAGRVGVNAFPTTWFVDRAGRIAFVKVGWSEALAEEFGWRVELLKAESPPTPQHAAPPDEAVLLRLRGQVGQVRHIRMVMDNFMHFGAGAPPSGDSARPTMRMIQFATETVTAISGDTVTVVLVTDSSRTAMTGLPVPSAMLDSLDSRGVTMTTRMDGRGRVISSATRGDARLEERMASVRRMLPGLDTALESSRGTVIRLPDRPVRVGETWADTSSMPRALGGPAGVVVATYRFERIEIRGGHRVAVISSDVVMPPVTLEVPMRMSSGPMHTVGETEFDLDAGWIVRHSSTMTGSTHTEMGDISMRMVMRQTPLEDQR